MQVENFSHKLLIILGALKCMLIAAFFVSFGFVSTGPAKAESVMQCGGVNLLEKLEADDPDAFARVQSEAALTLNGSNNFWKIEKAGLPISHIFGTMHVVDPKIATLSKQVKSTIEGSDRLIIESVDALDPAAAQREMAKLAHLTLLKEGTLRDLIKDDLEDELEAALVKRGMPIQLADRMQPWLIATMITLPACEMQRKQSGEKVLDAVLAQYAKDQGRQIEGLETVAEQLTALASLPKSYHVSALEETLANGSLGEDMIATLKALYLDGKMGTVLPLMREVAPESYSGEGAAQFQSALIEKRNHLMFERMLPMLETGKSFIGVGALHLPGKTGLVQLLKEAGFTVTPVSSNSVNG